MPNWKKIALSGSNPEFASLSVDGQISAQDLAVQQVNANTLTGSLSYPSLVDVPNLVSQSQDFTAGQVIIATAGATNQVESSDSLNLTGSITANTFTGSLLRLDQNGTGLRMTNVGAFDNDGSNNFRIFSNGDLILSTDGDSGTAVTLDQTTKDANFTGAVTASAFSGDGSALTNITVAEVSTVSDTFTSTTTKSVTHSFGTKNVIVQVYNDSDELIIPKTISTPDLNSVSIVLDETTTGRVVVAKGGHVVQDQTYRESVSGNTTYTLTHNLGQDYCIVQAYSSSKKQVLPADIESINANSVSVSFDNNFIGTIVVKS